METKMKDDIRDLLAPGPKSIGEIILLILASPLIIYYFTLSVFDYLIDMNSYLKDKLFLKRIRMTQEEFDEFFDYKFNKRDKDE
jgi:hypothetical protein